MICRRFENQKFQKISMSALSDKIYSQAGQFYFTIKLQGFSNDEKDSLLIICMNRPSGMHRKNNSTVHNL